MSRTNRLSGFAVPNPPMRIPSYPYRRTTGIDQNAVLSQAPVAETALKNAYDQRNALVPAKEGPATPRLLPRSSSIICVGEMPELLSTNDRRCPVLATGHRNRHFARFWRGPAARQSPSGPRTRAIDSRPVCERWIRPQRPAAAGTINSVEYDAGGAKTGKQASYGSPPSACSRGPVARPQSAANLAPSPD